MKNFEAGLDNVYDKLTVTEDLHLQKGVREEAGRPSFKNSDWVLAGVYDHINDNILGFDWDFNDDEIVNDLMGQFRQIKDTIERRYKFVASETKTAPDGHYYTKSGNLVKGRLSADAEERGARRSDPKDKQRSKTPPVSQYNEEIGGRGTITIVGSREHPGERKLLYTIDGSKEYQVGGIDFKNLTTGEIVTSNERIHTQLSRAIRFNPDFQEDGQPKYDVTSAATRASRDAGGPMTEVGDFKVSILWNEEEPKPLEVGESWNFKLVPESIPKQ